MEKELIKKQPRAIARGAFNLKWKICLFLLE